MQLYRVSLLAENFDVCFRFYRDVVGLECAWGAEVGTYADFKVGNRTFLALFKRDLMAKAVGTQDLPASLPTQDHTAIVLQVDDLDSTVLELNRKGASFITDPKGYPTWTIRAAHLCDTDGNLIELFTALPEEQWARDVHELDRHSESKL